MGTGRKEGEGAWIYSLSSRKEKEEGQMLGEKGEKLQIPKAGRH